jgi:hypothetical protein
MIGLIYALDLDLWAARIGAPPEFPRLVRRLVYATGRSLRLVNFPADEAIRLAGWDGMVIADEGTPNIPRGLSVWELGTGQDPHTKADDDYIKRTQDPLGANSGEATFVFVTPRKWPGKGAWAASRRAENKWKDVIALDAEDLVQWLESAPAVATWLARIIGSLSPDARGLEAECESYTLGTSPAFNLSGLLIGRDAERSHLIGLIQGAPTTIQISATTALEGVGFVGACIGTLPEDEREAVLARTVVVDSDAGMRQLAVSERPLLVLAAGDLSPTSGRHHRIIVKTGRGGGSNHIELGSQPVTPLVEYLAGLGLERNLAYQRCNQAAGYLERVRQTMLVVEAPPPAWALPPVSTTVAAAILLGEWDEARAEDRVTVEAISGVDYETFARALAPYDTGPLPLISRAGTIRRVYSRTRAWRLLEGFLTSSQFRAFIEAALSVLTENDPRFEVALDERWMAEVHGKRRAHSEQLRNGLSGGLVHAAVLGRDDAACYAGGRAQSWIDHALRRIFEKRKEPNFWRRIRDVLRELAEASPDAFLSALTAELRETAPQIMELFEDEGQHGGSLHTNLLWALELLAWSPDYVGQAARLLAALADREPGIKSGNRPERSLAEILHPVLHQCTLSSSDRVALFTAIAAAYPRVAWPLAVSLMPAISMFSTPTARPELRDWAPKQETPVVWADYWQEIEAILQRLLEQAGDSVDRWDFLLSNLKAMPEALAERVLLGAERLMSRLSAPERLILWRKLRRLLHHHNQFRDEQKEIAWLYPHTTRERLKSLYDSLAPDDLIDRSAWLFSGHVTRPDNISMDFAEENRRVDAERDAAILELSRLGLPALVAALPRFESHRLLGYRLGRSPGAVSFESAVLKQYSVSTSAIEQEFARGFGVARYLTSEQEFLHRWFSSESPDFLTQRGVATIAQALNSTSQLWDAVEAAGLEARQLYWKEAPVHLFREPRQAERAARNLLDAARPLDALDLLAVNLSGDYLAGEGDIRIVLDVLREGIAEINSSHARAQDAAYHIASLFKAIVDSKRLSVPELIRLEWSYFGALEYHAQHKLLIYRHLLSEPELLLQIVRLLYRPEGIEGQSQPEPSSLQQTLASQAWRILHHWAPYQELTPEDMPQPAEITTCIEKLRDLAVTWHHARVVDDLVGKALASSPVGSDGAWPHETVRDVLERIGSIEEVADGFVLGKAGLRGVTSRLPGDGGAQERDLANQYAAWQRQFAVIHPTTSGLLGRLAEHYRSDATMHDNLSRQH